MYEDDWEDEDETVLQRWWRERDERQERLYAGNPSEKHLYYEEWLERHGWINRSKVVLRRLSEILRTFYAAPVMEQLNQPLMLTNLLTGETPEAHDRGGSSELPE